MFLRTVLLLMALIVPACLVPTFTEASSTKEHHSRIHRSRQAKHDFLVQSGYPHGRKGYVVDHIVPLACGGADAPSNMQWQTIAEGKTKDKLERQHCLR